MRKTIILLLLVLFAFSTPLWAFQQVGFVGEYPFESPADVAADGDGKIYVAAKDSITVLGADGKLVLSWGGKDKEGKWKLSEPSGIALYGDRLYVTDSSEDRVLIFSKEGAYIDGFGAGGDARKEFSDPSAIFVYGGIIYVADTGNKRIQVFGPDGIYIGTIAAPADKPFGKPVDIALDHRGNIYVLDSELKVVRIFDPAGKHLKDIPGFKEPVSITMEADGFFVADNGDYKVKRFGLDGIPGFTFGVEGKNRGQFRRITAIAASAGKVYAADSKKNTIQVFAPEKAEAVSTESAPPPTSVKWLGDVKLPNAGKIYWDAKERLLYVIDKKQEAVLVVKGEKVEKTIKIKKVEPSAVVKDKAGFLWIADKGKDRILKLSEVGEILLSAGSSGKKEGYLSDPSDMAVSGKGFIYVADTGNGRVQLFNTDGIFIAAMGKGAEPPLIENPIAIALDRADNLYVLDDKKFVVAKFSPEGKHLSSFGREGSGAGEFKRPVDIEMANNEIFVLDGGLNRVLVFNPEGKFLREFCAGGQGKGDLKEPSSLSVLDGTSVCVSDTGNTRIQTVGILYTPAAPGRPKAEGGMREIRLRWQENTEDYIEKYIVYRAENSAGPFAAVATSQMSFYKDADVKPDKAYFYRVSVHARNGNESLKSETVDAKAEKYATSQPKGVEAVPSDREVALKWQPNLEAFVSHYAVYREDKGEFKLVGKAESAEFIDKTVKPNTGYTYKISSFSTDGVESPSVEIKAATLKETKPPLELTVVEMKNIFSNTYKIYEAEGLGKLMVTNNTADKIAKLKLSLLIKDFMDFATEVDIDNIEAGGKAEVVVKPVFNNKILAVTENTAVQMEVKAAYYENQQMKTFTNNYTLQLYEKHYLTWDVRERMGTFITPKDSAVMEFSRGIARQYRDMQDPIIYARGIYDALGIIGMAYMPDPTNPYQMTSEKADLVDYVQYPQETLKRKTGDCDDLVNLYSALLESLGIKTVLVDTPGHIFMMFSPGLKAPEAGAADDMFIVRDDALWVPVEVTMVGSSFLKAWKKGVENYKEGDGKGLEIVDPRKAWEKYKPGSLPASDWRAEDVKRADIDGKFPDELDYLRKLRIRRLSGQYLSALEKDPGNAAARVKLGIVYGESGEPAEALKSFEEVLASDPKNAAAKNNVGNVYFTQDKYAEAKKAYAEASELDPGDSGILVNLSMACLKLDQKEEAKAAYGRAVGLDPDVPKKYLGLSIEMEGK